MTNYLCSLSSNLATNYDRALAHNTWGVEDKYADRIRSAKPDDLLVFIVDRHFRSVHKITEGSFIDRLPIWSDRDGDRFANRVRFSDPLAHGHHAATPDQL